ncbi:short-chain dehydrogenase/reductase [Xylariaceae sp. FL0662B]|nr:short-chain dehydrogenase/reductase [Xylariaceae sp. FL0662B]
MPSVIQQFKDARHPPADPTHISFKDKTILVTGANDGLGFQAAIKFAQLGASKLILGVRSTEKGEAAKAAILSQTGNTPEFVIITVDLSTFASVKAFAKKVNQQVEKLHVVLLCAGVIIPTFQLSPEGYEINLQVNVLSTALMALLLVPKVRETAAHKDSDYTPHICILNSLATQETTSDMVPTDQTLLDRIGDESKFEHISQYYLVKLAARYFIRGLAEQMAPSKDIIVNSCCPGLCRTGLLRHYSLAIRIMLAPHRMVCGRTGEQGARTLVSATALGPESHGKLLLNDYLPAPAEFLATERSEKLYRATFQDIMSVLKERASFKDR